MTNETVQVPDTPAKITGVLWESCATERNVFIVYNDEEIFTYIYVKFSIYGTNIQQIDKTVLASKQVPLLMYNGDIMSATASGQLTQLNLTSHNFMQTAIVDRDSAALESTFNKQMALHK